MNLKIIIKTNEDKVVYKGNILEVPIKDDYIIKKSIEIFDDEDPCIIHKSFVIKKYVDELMNHTKIKDKKEVKLVDYKNYLQFLNIPELDSCVMILGDGK